MKFNYTSLYSSPLHTGVIIINQYCYTIPKLLDEIDVEWVAARPGNEYCCTSSALGRITLLRESTRLFLNPREIDGWYLNINVIIVTKTSVGIVIRGSDRDYRARGLRADHDVISISYIYIYIHLWRFFNQIPKGSTARIY